MIQIFRNAKCKKSMLKVVSILLVMAGLLTLLPNKATAATSSTVVQIPGTSGFMALSQYITPTEIPNVYKVALTINPTIKPTLTDIVIIVNEGHDPARQAVLQDSSSLPADAFGYKLDLAGNITNVPRRGKTSGFTVYDAELYSAETIIRKLADPSINANYQYTRVALVSYGVAGTGYGVLTRSGLIGLGDAANLQFLLSKIGAMDQTTYGTTNAVPLAKAVQQSYQILADPSEQLFFTYTGANPTVTSNDISLPYVGGIDSVSPTATNGAWKAPTGKTADSFENINKFIVSLHSIGASMNYGLGIPNGIKTTMYPLNAPSSPTNVQTVALTTPANQAEDINSVVPYNAARYVIKTVSDKLKGSNQSVKVFHPFTFWIDPSKLTDPNSPRWLDFNQTLSYFPISQGGIVPGSGYTPPSPSRKAMYFDSTAPTRTYENLEGVQYWSNVAEAHNIVDYTQFDPELTDLVNKISSYAKDAVVNSTFQQQFQVYDYPGIDRFTIHVSRDTSPSHDGGTVSYVNQKLTWNIGVIPETGTLTLSFYVYFDATNSSSDLAYLFSNTEFSYNYNGTVEKKDFPSTYLEGGDKAAAAEINNNNAGWSANESNGDNSINPDTLPSIENSTSASNSGVTGISVYGLNAPVAPYTPSVTPTPKPTATSATTITDESVDEETVEMPVTGGKKSIGIVSAFVVLALLCSVVVQKKRSKK